MRSELVFGSIGITRSYIGIGVPETYISVHWKLCWCPPEALIDGRKCRYPAANLARKIRPFVSLVYFTGP